MSEIIIQDPPVQVLEQLPQVIPAQQAPSCTRELFLRPPDWRYQTAVQYLQKQDMNIAPTIPQDPFIQLAIRALRATRNINTRDYLQLLWPDVISVIKLGTIAKSSSITSQIEANLICGVTAQQAKQTSFFIPQPVYELYAKLFFDLTGITAIHSWMNDFLFQPQKYKQDTSVLRSRLLAYYGGRYSGVRSSITGLYNESAKDVMKKIAGMQRQKKIFDYMTKITGMDTQTYVTLMQAAVKSMTERDFQEHMRDRQEAGSSSLQQLAEHLQQGIRAFSQQELDNTNSTGLDFVNQYTAAILRKDTEDNG